MKLSASDTQLLYQRPHLTNLWMSIYRPQTIFSCQVTGTYAQGDTQITFYNTSGTWGNGYANMTALVGDSRGDDSVARIRTRAITGTYALFAENSIGWKNNQWITFIDYVDISAVYPKIIKNPNVDDAVIFYKDGDIAYTNQNTIYGTFPNAGSHRAAFIETGSASLYYTATGTYNVAGSGLTYLWSFGGGTPTGSTALTPGLVTYSTAGHYKTTLKVTAANGAVDYTYRYVSIYNRPENGSNVPILKWTLNDLSGSREAGGYTASVRVHENLGSIEPNALVVVFADDVYGTTSKSIGGNGQSNSKIVLVGYILKDTIRFNYKDGWADFEIGSPTEVMKQSEGFSVSCESSGSPSTWYQLNEMTVQKALYHYLRWHSTVLNVADFQYTGDDRLVQYFDSDRSSLYDAVQSFLSEGVLGEVVSDRQGKLWAEITDVGYENPFASISENMTIQKNDWVGEPEISERRVSETSFVEMGGIVYNGVALNTFQALLSNAPSTTPLYRGRTDGSKQGLILKSQSQLNQITGNYLANKNSFIEDVAMSLAGNYRNFDIAPQEIQYLMIDENVAPNGISLIGKKFKLTSMNWNYNSEKEYFYPDVIFSPIVTGSGAETVIIPPTPPTDGYEYPTYSLPPLPGFNPTSPTTQQFSTTVLVFEYNVGILYTTNFDQTEPTWQVWNSGIDSADVLKLSDFFITPNGSVWASYHTSTTANIKSVYYAPYVGGVFQKVIDSTWLTANVSSIARIIGLGYRKDQPETIAMITNSAIGFGEWNDFWLGNRNGFTKKSSAYRTASSPVPGTLTFGDNSWVHFTESYGPLYWDVFSSGGSYTRTLSLGNPSNAGVAHAQKGKNLFGCVSAGTTNNGFVSTDTASSKTTINNPVLGIGYLGAPAYDESGKYLMAPRNSNYPYKSYDYGFSWTQITNLPVQASWFVTFCGGEGVSSRWATAGSSYIFGTYNFGADWSRKDTYIPQYITPLPTFGRIFAFVESSDV